MEDPASIPGSERSPGEGTPVLLPGEFHGQRSLVDYSPWGSKESDTTEGLTLSLSTIQGTKMCQLNYNEPQLSISHFRRRVGMQISNLGFFTFLWFLSALHSLYSDIIS